MAGSMVRPQNKAVFRRGKRLFAHDLHTLYAALSAKYAQTDPPKNETVFPKQEKRQFKSVYIASNSHHSLPK